jgi:hypothetical protein
VIPMLDTVIAHVNALGNDNPNNKFLPIDVDA